MVPAFFITCEKLWEISQQVFQKDSEFSGKSDKMVSIPDFIKFRQGKNLWIAVEKTVDTVDKSVDNLKTMQSIDEKNLENALYPHNDGGMARHSFV